MKTGRTARPAVGTCPPQAGVSQRGAGERRACARAMDRGVAADGFDAAALMSNAEPLPLPPLVCGNGKQARRGALRERSGTATRSAAAAVAVHSQLGGAQRRGSGARFPPSRRREAASALARGGSVPPLPLVAD